MCINCKQYVSTRLHMQHIFTMQSWNLDLRSKCFLWEWNKLNKFRSWTLADITNSHWLDTQWAPTCNLILVESVFFRSELVNHSTADNNGSIISWNMMRIPEFKKKTIKVVALHPIGYHWTLQVQVSCYINFYHDLIDCPRTTFDLLKAGRITFLIYCINYY